MHDVPRPSIESLDQPTWRDRTPWLLLCQLSPIALSPPTMLIAMVGAILTTTCWWLCDAAFVGPDQLTDNVPLQVDVKYFGLFPGQREFDSCPIGCYKIPWIRDAVVHTGPWPDDPILAVPYRFCRPFFQLIRPGGSWGEFAYYLFGGLGMLAVWSLFGAAITRTAVLKIGRGEAIYPSDSIKFAKQRFGSHIAAVTCPLIMISMMAIPLMALGWMMRANLGVAIVGCLFVAILPIGLLMSLIGVAWSLGWPLAWGSLSSDGMDSFDAMSRSFSYACHRPLRYLAYAGLAMTVGMFSWLVVWGFSELIIQTGISTLELGTGTVRMAEIRQAMLGQPVDSGLVRFGGSMMAFWIGLIRTAASAFAFSYFWCMVAGIYLLLRLDVDSTEMDEIFVDRPPSTIQQLKSVSADNDANSE